MLFRQHVSVHDRTACIGIQVAASVSSSTCTVSDPCSRVHVSVCVSRVLLQHTDNLDWTSRHSNTSWPTPHPPQPQPSPTSTLPAHSSSLLTRAAHNTHPPPHTHEGATGSETAMPSQGVGAVGVSVCEGDDWDSAAPFLSLLLSDEMDIDVLGTLTQLLAGELGGADSQPAESATQTPRDKGDKGKGGEGATGTAQRKTRKRKAPGEWDGTHTRLLHGLPWPAWLSELVA